MTNLVFVGFIIHNHYDGRKARMCQNPALCSVFFKLWWLRRHSNLFVTRIYGVRILSAKKKMKLTATFYLSVRRYTPFWMLNIDPSTSSICFKSVVQLCEAKVLTLFFELVLISEKAVNMQWICSEYAACKAQLLGISMLLLGHWLGIISCSNINQNPISSSMIKGWKVAMPLLSQRPGQGCQKQAQISEWNLPWTVKLWSHSSFGNGKSAAHRTLNFELFDETFVATSLMKSLLRFVSPQDLI